MGHVLPDNPTLDSQTLLGQKGQTV
jgi:hypothetical protein